jgi:hypothetical protein
VTGNPGATGATGALGAQGAIGAAGAVGAQGANGTPGNSGATGASGTAGGQGAVFGAASVLTGNGSTGEVPNTLVISNPACAGGCSSAGATGSPQNVAVAPSGWGWVNANSPSPNFEIYVYYPDDEACSFGCDFQFYVQPIGGIEGYTGNYILFTEGEVGLGDFIGINGQQSPTGVTGDNNFSSNTTLGFGSQNQQPGDTYYFGIAITVAANNDGDQFAGTYYGWVEFEAAQPQTPPNGATQSPAMYIAQAAIAMSPDGAIQVGQYYSNPVGSPTGPYNPSGSPIFPSGPPQ